MPLVIPAAGWAARVSAARLAPAVYAAAHVAASRLPPRRATAAIIDWEATLRFRDHLWAHGFAVAEAMDTAQRGMGLTWGLARELIADARRRAAPGRAPRPAARMADAPTLRLRRGPPSRTSARRRRGPLPIGKITDAYTEQVAFVQSAGAQVILMASRALAAAARGPRDYLEVYGALLKQADQPVILHWLGEAFDPALRGYWGGTDFDAAAATVLELIERAGGKVDGIKLSVLDAGQEVALRRRLPAGVRLYTGDDFSYAGLIRGDADGSTATRCSARSPRSPPRPRRRWRPSTRATSRATTPRSGRRSRSAERSSSRRLTTTRSAWPSWPG